METSLKIIIPLIGLILGLILGTIINRLYTKRLNYHNARIEAYNEITGSEKLFRAAMDDYPGMLEEDPVGLLAILKDADKKSAPQHSNGNS